MWPGDEATIFLEGALILHDIQQNYHRRNSYQNNHISCLIIIFTSEFVAMNYVNLLMRNINFAGKFVNYRLFATCFSAKD